VWVCGREAGPGAVGFCSGSDSCGQVVDQRGAAVGPLSGACESAKRAATACDFEIFRFDKLDSAFFVRSGIPDTVVAEHSAVEFEADRVAGSFCIHAPAGGTVCWRLL